MKPSILFCLPLLLFGCFLIPEEEEALSLELLVASALVPVTATDIVPECEIEVTGFNTDDGAIALINLGDSLTAGDQDGALHEYTQNNGYTRHLADALSAVLPLNWNGPLIDAALSDVNQINTRVRKDAEQLPYNLGVSGATVRSLLEEKSNAGNHTLTTLFSPVPCLVGGEVSQLEAAEYVLGLHTERSTIVTLWIGSNDVLGATGVALTAGDITNFLENTADGHDLNSLTANLTTILDRLSVFENATIFMATLPDVTGGGVLFDEIDIERMAVFADADVTGLDPGEAVSTLAFWLLVAPELDGDNTTLNAAVDAVKILGDDYTLTTAEAALIQDRVVAMNDFIRDQAATRSNVFLIDSAPLFADVSAGNIVLNGFTYNDTFGVGGAISLDGIHPSNTGHALIANLFIEGIDAALNLGLSSVDAAVVQGTDPHFDSDGDGFMAGPQDYAVLSFLSVLADCDDTDPAVYAPILYDDNSCP